MDDVEPRTSSTNELVEKRRFRGSLRCQAADVACGGSAMDDGAGADEDRRASSSGLVAARPGDLMAICDDADCGDTVAVLLYAR